MEDLAKTKLDLIHEVEGLFQTVITVSLFFLTVTNILFRIANTAPEQLADVELKWLSMPGAIILGYVMFRIFKKHYKSWILKFTNALLLAQIVCIAVITIVIVMNGEELRSYIAYYSLKISLWGAISLPTIIFILMLLGAIFFKNKNNLQDLNWIKKVLQRF